MLRPVKILYGFICLTLVTWTSIFPGCAKPEKPFPRIGLIGTEDPSQRVDEALPRMGEPFEVIDSVTPEALSGFDLIIVGKGAYTLNDGGLADNYRDVLDYVEKGGCLLVFGLNDRAYRREFLPYEIRFAAEDPSGWGNVDYSEQIATPEHPVFNKPHHLTYLAGMEEFSRIVYTAPEWKILLAKDPRHPSKDARIEKLDLSVGSIFEAGFGSGQILVCQPIIDRYHAGNAAIVPHPLEEAVLLFENLVEYMKARAAGKDLPLATVTASPGEGPAGRPVRFKVNVAGGAASPLSFAWDFGDGSQSGKPSPEHKYSRDGEYWVTVKVTDAKGATDHAACRVEVGPAKAMRWAGQLTKALMKRYYLNPGEVKPNYRTALLLSGMLGIYDRTADKEILDYIESFFQIRFVSKWDSRPYKGDTQTGTDFVDLYSLMAPAHRLYKITGNRTYLEMAQEVWRQSLGVDKTLPPGTLWSPWTWGGTEAIVDFTYFKAQLRVHAWQESGDMSLLDESAAQMIRFTGYMLDPSDSLYFQAIDLKRKAYFCSDSRPSGVCDSKWGRGNGWVALAFAELMPYLPENHPRKKKLVEIVRGFFGGILKAQDPTTGLWAMITDKLDYPGMWLETTSTSMFVYAMVRLVEEGILPEKPFLNSARRGYNGLMQRIRLGAFNYPYLSDACEGSPARVNMTRWLQAHRRDNDFHVLGPFLMAEEALWRAAPPEVAVVGDLHPRQSRLGPVLNESGAYFYQIPGLYTAGDLGLFKAIIVDKGALDRNDADVRAYHKALLEYAENGGTLVYFPQEDDELLLEALPPGIEFIQRKDGRRSMETGPDWLTVRLGPEKEIGIAVKKLGRGKVAYCSAYPPGCLSSEPESKNAGWQECLGVFKELLNPVTRQTTR
jgi:unsaturated rhamnogalacturonyl hydrolase